MTRLWRPRPTIDSLKLAAALACAALATAPAASAAPGDLDSSFGTGGIALTPFSTDDYARDVALQPDGKAVVAGTESNGSQTRFALARYNADGSLDSGFGTAGKVVTSLGSDTVGNAVALQPDGKIVVAGGVNNDFALARYNADGSLDTSFSGDGMVTTSVGSTDKAWDVSVDPDGKIVAAGQATVGGGDRMAIVRYTSAGVPDSGFGSSGRATALVGNESFGMALVRQSSGRYVVAGGSSAGGPMRYTLARFGSNGALDTSFGSAGSVTTAAGFGALASSASADATGRIVVAGMGLDGIVTKAGVARYSADGVLDTSFSGDGVAFVSFGGTSMGWSVAHEADGKILVGGDNYGSSTSRLGLARLNADGSLDSTFGSGGTLTTPIGSRSGANAVVVQPDGKLLAAGSGNGGSGGRQFALSRYSLAADPAPDPGPTPDPDPTPDPGTTDPGPTEPPVEGGTGGGKEITPIDELGVLPPGIKPIVMPQQAFNLQGTGTVPVKLRCSDLVVGTCKGTVTIAASEQMMYGYTKGNGGGSKKGRITASRRRKAKGKRMVRIARRKVSLPAGTEATSKLPLTPAAKKALRARGSLTVTIEVTMIVDGEPRTSSRTVKLKPARRGR